MEESNATNDVMSFNSNLISHNTKVISFQKI